ncbi:MULTISPECIES: hypothetical protein [Pseudoalteromonas]|uniref:hypothetical protein n=1 Tax=Pseudoalteromonas TaxID=53246 RepID=UPI001EF54506|nr:hypothetical protein [Pseudoalteromonas sp. Of11M-6]MCG7555875.1 hypothetical protein [Pseudoalteromonas sp. Of11M-6]
MRKRKTETFETSMTQIGEPESSSDLSTMKLRVETQDAIEITSFRLLIYILSRKCSFFSLSGLHQDTKCPLCALAYRQREQKGTQRKLIADKQNGQINQLSKPHKMLWQAQDWGKYLE